VENDRELAGHGDGCLLVANLPGQPGALRWTPEFGQPTEVS
jgi:hypothetical protein